MEQMEKAALYRMIEISKDEEIEKTISILCSQGYYSVLLRDCVEGDERVFGRRPDDFNEGTLIFRCPDSSRTMPYEPFSSADRWLVAFRSDLFGCSMLRGLLSECSFFSYYKNEALHLSLHERMSIVGCMNDIYNEMQRPADSYSQMLLAKYVGCLLDYGRRFYDRQFYTRFTMNERLLAQYHSMLDQYIEAGKLQAEGIPSVAYCAEKLSLSPCYFEDLVKHESGRLPEFCIQLKRIEAAKYRLRCSGIPMNRIAEDLGFPSFHYFSVLFKKITGLTPGAYRMMN